MMIEKKTFEDWLMQEKGLSYRSAQDVGYRLTRAMRIVDASDLNIFDIKDKLEASEEFIGLQKCVKSQIRRSINLYREYTMK